MRTELQRITSGDQVSVTFSRGHQWIEIEGEHGGAFTLSLGNVTGKPLFEITVADGNIVGMQSRAGLDLTRFVKGVEV